MPPKTKVPKKATAETAEATPARPAKATKPPRRAPRKKQPAKTLLHDSPSPSKELAIEEHEILEERSSHEHAASEKEESTKAPEVSEKETAEELEQSDKEEEDEGLVNKRTMARKRDLVVTEEGPPSKKEKTETSKRGRDVEGSTEEADYQPDEEGEKEESSGSGFEHEPSDILKPKGVSKAARVKTAGKPTFDSIKSSKEGSSSEKKIITPKTIDVESMEKLGIWEEMQGYFRNIGWESFVQMPGVVYGDLVREFVTNMVVKDAAKVGLSTPCLWVKLNGKQFKLSVNDVNQGVKAVDFWDLQQPEYQEAYRKVPDQTAFEIKERWELIGTTPRFQSGYTKGHELKSEALRLCHRVLAYNFYGKESNSNSISQKELFILWCMETKKRVNFGALAIVQLSEISKSTKGKIALGHFITELAKGMRVLNEWKITMTPLPEEKLDIACLQRMMEVEISKDGELIFVTREKKGKQAETEELDVDLEDEGEVLKRLKEVEKANAENRKILMEILEAVKDIKELVIAGYGPGKPCPL